MPANVQEKAAPKFEVFVEKQLSEVQNRIRTLDIVRTLLALTAVVLGYGLLLAVFDLVTHGAGGGFFTFVRIVAFLLFVMAGAYFFARTLFAVYRRVNPYYAARQLERAVPDAKNSVINWLDLRGRELPSAIRGALGVRAARDLQGTVADQVVDGRSNWLLTSIVVGLILGLMGVFAFGPNQFGSLMRRAYVPFADAALSSRVRITLLAPEGDLTLPQATRIAFRAAIEGRVPAINQPGAPRLLYRYNPDDPYGSQPLNEEADGTYAAALLADQVRTGFWYKVTAGDAETKEYRVSVRIQPQIAKVEIGYHYRPYRKLEDHAVTFPNEQAVLPRIHDYRGTEVSVVVHANSEIAEGHLILETPSGTKDLLGAILTEDHKAFRTRFTLEESGTFRILFLSKDRAENIDRASYSLEVLDDKAPTVILTKPGEDVTLPANGTLPLEGSASDDFGLTRLALHMRSISPLPLAELAAKVYREDKKFQFDDGRYPDNLDYKDFLALDSLKDALGKAFAVREGMTLEYWLEATDNCDYPNAQGNVGKSKTYKINIVAPQDEKKKKEDRQKAEKEKNQHDEEQDKQQKKENQKHVSKQTSKQNEQKDGEGKKESGNGQDQEPNNGSEGGDQKKDNILEKIQNELSKKKKGEDQKDPEQLPDPRDPPKGGQQPEPKSSNDNAKQNPSNSKEKKDSANGSEKQKTQSQGPQDKQGGDGPKSGDNGPGDPKSTDPQNGQNPKGQPPDPGKSGNGASEQPKSADDGPKGNANQAQSDPKTGKPEQAKTPAKTEPGDKGPDTKTEPKSTDASSGNDPGTPKADPAVKGNGTSPDKAQKGANDNGPGKGNSQEPPKTKPEPKTDGSDEGKTINTREPTLDDIERLKDKMRKPGPESDEAGRQLEEASREARDPKVQEAAREALKQAGGEPKGADGAKGGGDAKSANPPKEASKPKGDDAKLPKKTPGDKIAKDDGQPKEGKGGGPKDNGSKGSGAGKDAAGPSSPDNTPPTEANKDFTNRGGNLQLEDLKKLVTPEVLKKAGVSEQEWEDYLKKAASYNPGESVGASGQSKLTKGQSTLPSTGATQLKTAPPGGADPLTSGRALPPREYEELYRQFTTGGKK